MVASVVGFIWQGGGAIVDKGLKFKEAGNKFATKIDGKNREFYTLPQQAELIEADQAAIDALKSTRMLYITSDPNSTLKQSIALAEFEIGNIFIEEGIYATHAFTTENEFGAMQLTCDNATAAVPVIYFTNSTETKISYENNCIIIESTSDFNMLSVRDRLLYGYYGILK